jgi:hypothetical protein
MFDLFFEGAIAFEQVMLLVAGLLCMGLGGLLVGYEIHRRLRGVRVTGTVIGVRESKPGMYQNVYRYMLPTGEMHEGTSDVGSNSTSGRHTGRTVELLVLADRPERVSEAGSYIAGAFGALLLTGGLWPLYIAMTQWRVTPFVWLVLAGCIAYLAVRIRKHLIPESQRKSLPQWQAELRAKRLAELQAMPVRRIEEILSKPEGHERAILEAKTGRIGRPALILAGIAAVGLAVYVGRDTAQLSTTGERAPGRVVEVRAESDSDGTTYRAVVRFDAGGKTVQFRDKVGSYPPSHRVGETVAVLYLKRSPAASAIIDRGAWNWLPAIGLGVFGVLLCWAGSRLGGRHETLSIGSPTA